MKMIEFVIRTKEGLIRRKNGLVLFEYIND